MSAQDVALRGLSVRRQFDHSRLEEELLESVYDTLLAASLPEGASAAGDNKLSLAAWQETEQERAAMAAA